MSIYELMLIVFVINLPFGHLRSKSTKFSRKWMMAIHVPIPFIILLRVLSGFNWTTIPFMILAAIVGQMAGGKLTFFIGKEKNDMQY
jgi:hypothetical protein